MPLVSVAIATYNCARFLPEAIRSALAQTHRDIEVLVVDDGSEDDTTAVLAEFAHDPRLRAVRIEHAGHAPAKNHAASLARGEWIAFLDADDVWLPQKLERQLAAAEAHPEAAVVYCRRRVIDEDGRPMVVPPVELHRGRVLDALLVDNFICFSTAMVRRTAREAAGPFDESLVYPIDYDLWLRLAARHPFEYVDDELVLYRRMAGNMTGTLKASARREQIDRVMDKFYRAHADDGVINPQAWRRAQYIRCCNLGYQHRDSARAQAVRWYAQALKYTPWDSLAWRGLASALTPPSWRAAARRALGRS